MARRRGNSKPILAVILRQIDAFKNEIETPGEDGVVPDLDLMWEWISPNGQIRREVTRTEFEGGSGAEGWPLPGTYRVTIVDSNGEPDSRFDPWEAEHVDKDALTAPRAEDGGGIMGAVHGLLEESRVTVRDMRRELNDAKRREQEADRDKRQAQSQLAAAQQEVVSHKLAAERAIAEKAYAEAKQKDAEEAYRELERSVSAFEPQIKAGVDRLAERFLGPFMPAAEEESAPESTERTVAPAPGGDDSPERAKAVIDGTFEAIFTNLDVIRPLVEAGVVEWATVRYVIWKYSGVDVGDKVDWSHWSEGEETEASDVG